MKLNILIINHYAGSPEMGMEYRPYYFAKLWTEMGHNVTILAASYSHIRKNNPVLESEIKEEKIDGINYIWINTPEYEGNGLSRVKNMYSFIRQTLYKASYFVKAYKPNIVIASSTYPSDNYLARKICKLSKAKHLYEVHDLWPLSPMELGNMSKYNPFIVAMQHAENFAYRKADAVISMLPKTQEHMKTHGLDLKKWHYIPNGIVVEDWELKKDLNPKFKNKITQIKSTYKYTVAYTGTFGLANNLDTLIKAASLFDDIAFIIVGKGPEKENLSQMIADKNLSNVFIFDVIGKLEIPSFLEMIDFLFIGLKKESLFRFGISPNKLIDYMMAGKPIIQAIDSGNNIVKNVGCGISIEPENAEAIALAVNELKQTNPDKLQEMGMNGKNFVLKNHDYKVLAKQFEEIMLNL